MVFSFLFYVVFLLVPRLCLSLKFYLMDVVFGVVVFITSVYSGDLCGKIVYYYDKTGGM